LPARPRRDTLLPRLPPRTRRLCPPPQSDEDEDGIRWLDEGDDDDDEGDGDDEEEFLDPEGGEAIQQLGNALGEGRRRARRGGGGARRR
jgi:hypothetical protein